MMSPGPQDFQRWVSGHRGLGTLAPIRCAHGQLRHRGYGTVVRRLALLLLLTGPASCARKTAAGSPNLQIGAADRRLDRVIADYVGLWRRETLPQWETLFLPSFTAANTRPDGSTNLRTREQFLEAQRQYHARVDNLKEELENVRVERRGRMASVWADFVVTDSGKQNRGRLVLLIMEDRGEYKVHSLMFSYDP